MENFEEIAEKILNGELKGTFVLKNGETRDSKLLTRNNNGMSDIYPYYLIDVGSLTEKGRSYQTIECECDVVGFVKTVIDKENTLNINTKIRVVLTKDGAEAINKTNNDEINEYLAMFPNADTNFLKTNYVEGDVIEDALWHVFSLLGNYFKGNTNAPFENNLIKFIE